MITPEQRILLAKLRAKVLPLLAMVTQSTDGANRTLSQVDIWKWEAPHNRGRIGRQLSVGVKVSEKVGPRFSDKVIDTLVEEFCRIDTMWLDGRDGIIKPRTNMPFSGEESDLLERLDLEASKLGAFVSSCFNEATGNLSSVSLVKSEYMGREFVMSRYAAVSVQLRIMGHPKINNPCLTEELCDRLIEELKTLKDLCPQ